MLDPITIPAVLGGMIVSGIIGNRADEFAVNNWRQFLDNSRQYRPGENHELQRALYRAYLQATLQICAQRGEKLGMPVSKWLLSGMVRAASDAGQKIFRSNAVRSLKAEAEWQWIDQVKDDICDKLKKPDLPADYENKELDDLQKEVELLIQVKETTQREAQLRQPLIERAIKDLEAKHGAVPDDFKRLFNKCWFNYICACFQYQLADNSHIAVKFQNRLLAKITTRKESGEVSEVTVVEIQNQLQQLGGEMAHRLTEIKILLDKQQRKLDEVERDIWLPILALDQDTNAMVSRLEEALQRIEDNLTPKINTIAAGMEVLVGKKTETESQTYSQADLSRIEQRYRELARISCNIIDLAQLPKPKMQDEPQRKLTELYVPLRVKIEYKPDSTFSPKSVEAWETTQYPTEGTDQGSERRSTITSFMSKNDEPIENPEDSSVEELLTIARHSVVLGKAGAGKTTLIRWIAFKYLLPHENGWDRLSDGTTLPDEDMLPNEDWLPIILRCRDFKPADFDDTIEDIMLIALKKLALKKEEAEIARSLLMKRLETGFAILLIDGLDEIADQHLCERFCKTLKSIHNAYPNAAIIITSRPATYREMKDSFREFYRIQITGLSEKGQDNLVSKYFSLQNRQSAEVAKLVKEFRDEVNRLGQIGELASNPFLLTAMARLKENQEVLPTKRSSVYNDLIHLLIRSRSSMDDKIKPQEALPLLQYLAYEMCDQGVARLRQDKIIDILQCVCTDYPSNYDIQNIKSQMRDEKFLRRLEDRTGLIKEIDKVYDSGLWHPIYEFEHKTFQEYFAALAVYSPYYRGGDTSMPRTERISSLVSRLIEKKLGNQDTWREVLRFFVSCDDTPEADTLIKAIVDLRQDENAEVTTRPRSVLAVFCLADELYVREETVRYVLRKFISQINSEDGKYIPPTSSDNAIIPFRRFPTDFVEVAIEFAHSRRWGKILTPILIEGFGSQDSKRIDCGGLCGVIVASFAPQDEVKRREWFISKLYSDEETSMIEAALGIMEFAFENASKPSLFNPSQVGLKIIEKLLSMLSGSATASRAAAWAVRWLNDSSYGLRAWRPSKSELKRIASVVKNVSTDADAADYLCFPLGKISKALEIKSKAKQAVERLIMRLQEEDSEVRKRVVLGLSEIKDKGAVEALLARLSDNESLVRSNVAWALGEIKDKSAVEDLIKTLGDNEKEVRSNVAWALGEIKDKSAVEDLIKTLGDNEKEVRSDAAVALGKIKSVRAVKDLIARLEDPEGDVQQAAAWALGEIKNKRAIRKLINKLKSDVITVRSSAAAALGKIKNEQTVEALIMALEDDVSIVRQDVAWALGEIKDKRAVEALMSHLEDDGNEVWKYAAGALGKINDISMVERLIAMLKDTKNAGRWAAALVLGQIKDRRAVEPLIDILTDSDNNLRSYAAFALGEIRDKRAIDALITKLEDNDGDVRYTVADALIPVDYVRGKEVLMGRLSSDRLEYRKEALGGLLRICKNDTDAKLLSENLDAKIPILDPQEEITEARVRLAAELLKIRVGEVRRRYEELAADFSLNLAWSKNKYDE